jgi:tRNA pseudouridine38-40 synthase
MPERMVQLVLHYDGAGFSGWQRQPATRTIQGVLEGALARLCNAPVSALGAGRTDAGVHARGQSVGVRVPVKWDAAKLRRALNAVLPADVWVASAVEMSDAFHARFSATGRRYSYHVGTDREAHSPFRRRWEWAVESPLARSPLADCANALLGTHRFLAFAVQGTAPENDDHRCSVVEASWRECPNGLVFEVEANRFLHHMVRFLVGTMIEIARGKRPLADFAMLLAAEDNRRTSAPAPPHALFLEVVRYPRDLYLGDT